jgi:phosphate starvation-inducible protein PhoH
VTFSSSSKKLALDVIEIVNSLGGIAHLTEKLTFFKGVEHKLSYFLYINLPEGIAPFKLKRKLDRYKPNTKYSPKRYISNVAKIGKEECQCILVDNDEHLYLTKNYIVTHNTHLAVFSALELLKNGHVDKIIYIRSVVESSSRSIGFLKGDENEKFLPYIMPMLDKLNEILSKTDITHLMENEYIKAIPVNFVRGLTFHRCAVIIDEAQNMTKGEITTILTRFGRHSRYFVLGDAAQADINDSGFTFVYDAFDTDFSVKNDIQCVKFDISDIVRSQILKHITQVLKV